ncbi:hypothetical protein IFM89_033081 [Coptis chinensis]|uniref:Uncharacterized protein n=1 Tax=Coptis chinensis TaxID=261450 RepID=A0A835IFT3_9MAGN|nr:hypothetical protein IFM89_033081 [Coptis chinensis]
MADITYLCKRTVVSTKPVQPGKYHSLSVLDHAMEPSNLRLVFYYYTSAGTELGNVTKKLTESFSEMLTSFPMVTGRLQKTPEGRWKIKCNDAGVRTVEARAKGSVEEWLETADREQELKLVYWEDIFYKPYFWSTFYIQLTEFEGGGIAIGLSCSHLLGDATSATMLVKAWADTAMFGKMISPPHFHSVPPRRIGNKDVNKSPHIDMINCYKSSLDRKSNLTALCIERYATVTFVFDDEMVRKCMAEAQAGAVSLSNDSSASPFAALASLFWLSVNNLKGRKGGLSDMSICLDKRIALGLDNGFFGNYMIFNKVCGEESMEVGLPNAAKAIENAMQKMGNEGIMDLLEWLESNSDGDLKNDYKPPPPINGPDLVCANWESLNPYSAIFESRGKPIRVSYYFERVFGEGQILILPSPDGNSSLSRVAMVTLPEHQVVKLCEEDLILRFSPTILMGMNKI